MKLSLRLETIKNLVPKSSIVGDIGSDHAKLIIALVEENIISSGYAVENKIGPFNRLKEAVERANLNDKITCLLSDGIKDIPFCVDTLVLAGLGGSLIVDILKKDSTKLEHVNTIICDAHNDIPKVREEVSKMGYTISDEKIIEDNGKYYEIIKFIRSTTTLLSDLDKKFGPILREEKSVTFKNKYYERINEIDYLLTLPNLSEEKIIKLKLERSEIKSVL